MPREWRERYRIRRYGFRGLSPAYCSQRAAHLLNQPLDALRIITCHLGAGASLAAVLNGRSVDTTMGFTPLEGLVMATRSGTVDPGLILWLQEHEHLSPHQIAADRPHHEPVRLGRSAQSMSGEPSRPGRVCGCGHEQDWAC